MAHEHGPHTCYCPSCGYRITVAESVRCNTQKCPSCGQQMRAEETGEYRSNRLASTPTAEKVGYNLDQLAQDIEELEPYLYQGGGIDITICTESLPSQEDLANMVLSAADAGLAMNWPNARMNGGIPTTRLTITRGTNLNHNLGAGIPLGQWQAIIPILVPLATIGIIAYSIVKIGDVSKALMPILLVIGGVVIVSVALLRKPATAYVERGGKIPYLPSTKKKPTRDEVEIHTWQERDRAHIEVRNKKTGKTVAEWWDEAVQEMFEDGFFKGGMPREHWHGSEKPSWQFENSVYEYMEDMGMLAKRQHAMTLLPSVVESPKVLAAR